MLKRLEKQRAEEIYSLMKKDFREEELPDEKDFYTYVEDGSLLLYAYIEESKEKAYMVWIKKSDVVLITHLAVKAEYRGSGIGSKMIEEMVKTFPQIKQWFVEAETQKEANTEEEFKNIQRRLRFYEKLGFQRQEKIDYMLYGVSYYLYIKGEQEIEPVRLVQTIKNLYGNHIPENKFYIKIRKENKRK